MVVVQKYGGSSVADVARLGRVAERVVATVKDGHQVVVVVSAMGNTTNELLALARQVSASPGRRELDLLVSVGERVSMTLLAMAIEGLGVPAESFTGSQSGIITDDEHARATVVEVRPHRIRRALEQGKVAIVAGFQGVSRTGEVTTLGRGGSDTTAVVLTAALQADHCEICSDVDGVYSADPRVVAGAHRLPSLPLDAAAALAQGGSKVLAAEAIDQARRWGVTLVASATEGPRGQGTRVGPGAVPSQAVAVASDVEIETFVASGPAWQALRVPWRRVASHEGAVQLWLDLKNTPDRRLLDAVPGLSSRGRVGWVTVVGGSPTKDPAALARWTALARSARWWADADRFTAEVEPARVAAVVAALHAALFETPAGGPDPGAHSGE